jgi:hypothetical protein
MGLLVKGPVEPSPRDVDVGSEEWVDGMDSEVAGWVGCSAFIVSGKVGWFGVVGGERRGPGSYEGGNGGGRWAKKSDFVCCSEADLVRSGFEKDGGLRAGWKQHFEANKNIMTKWELSDARDLRMTSLLTQPRLSGRVWNSIKPLQ